MNYLEIEAMKYWSFPSSYSKEKKEQEINLILGSDNYVGTEKIDGYWEMFYKNNDGDFFIRSREKGVNGWICKQDFLPHMFSFFESLPNNTCLLGEVFLDGETSKGITKILGCGLEKSLLRQKETPLKYYIFDVLCYDNVELHTKPIEDRIEYLKQIEQKCDNKYIKFAKYLDKGYELRELWNRTLSQGGEGVVLTQKGYCYNFGKRTARKTLKIKKELSENLDVFLTGRYKEATKLYTGKNMDDWQYWYDEIADERLNITLKELSGTAITGLVPVTKAWYYDWASAVEIGIIFNGVEVPIGWISGISDEVKKGIKHEPEKWYHKVAELQAMDIDKTQSPITLRHAKILRWRDDKNWDSCTMEV